MVPKAGASFVVLVKPWLEEILWTESPRHAGFLTYVVGRPEYWSRLQELGAAPRNLEYDMTTRGQANFEEASRRFTLFAN
jgi:hypothetical protein